MLTTASVVSEIPEPKQPAPAGHGGGMGDIY
jgi:chaperonin GroEL